MKRFAVLVALLVPLSVGCGNSQSSTSPSVSPASPTITERFTGTLPVGGRKFYSFSLAVYGTVNATLAEISGPDVPPDVTVGLGIGTPSGTSCSASSPTNVSTTGTALVTLSEQPGVYCVSIVDVGNLPAAAAFVVTIDHP